MRRKTVFTLLSGLLAVLMLFSMMVTVVPTEVSAASSSAIKKDLDKLKAEAKEIQAQQKELKAQQDANKEETKDLVEQKAELEQQIKLIHDEIENINAQIQTYNQLIAEKQKELDDAKTRQQELSQQYSTRIRAMEKNSHISFWSVLFESSSFAEFLSNVRMMADIAKADQAMMKKLQEAADAITAAQTELSAEKQGLGEQRAALTATQEEMDAKNAEASLVLDQLNDNAAQMDALMGQYEDQEAELTKKIAKTEKEYNDAVRDEQNNSGGGGGGGGGGGSWAYPLPYRAKVTSPYGWRTHPITGKRSFHTGVDLAASKGTAIYACRGGTVTEATYSSVYGYYVTINHGDGFSTLYGHMTHYTVKVGQTVSKGQTIGYVGSTGMSTGPHLHLTFYKNGDTVNPMNYIG